MASRFLSLRASLRSFNLPPTRTYTSTVRRYAEGSSSDSNPHPQREAQLDRKKMNTEPNEYAKGGSDAQTAAESDTAFDPNSSNDPDEARKEAGKGRDVNPLDTSPANQELSHGTSEVSGGVDKKLSEGGGGRQGGGDSTGDKTAGSSV